METRERKIKSFFKISIINIEGFRHQKSSKALDFDSTIFGI